MRTDKTDPPVTRKYPQNTKGGQIGEDQSSRKVVFPIRKFLDLPDPDPLVGCTDPDP